MLSTRECALYLGFVDEAGRPQIKAFLKWLDHIEAKRKQAGLQDWCISRKVGRSVRVHEDDLEAAVPPRKTA